MGNDQFANCNFKAEWLKLVAQKSLPLPLTPKFKDENGDEKVYSVSHPYFRAYRDELEWAIKARHMAMCELANTQAELYNSEYFKLWLRRRFGFTPVDCKIVEPVTTGD
jgi:hypothetical protein